jgi:MFS family permease
MNQQNDDSQTEAGKLSAGSEVPSTTRKMIADIARIILGFVFLGFAIGYVVAGLIAVTSSDWTWQALLKFLAMGVVLFFAVGLISNFIDSLESPQLHLMPWDRPRRFLLSYPLWTTIAFTCIGGSYGFFRNGASSSTLWWIVNSAVAGMFSTPFWCLQLPWLRAFFRIPHVTIMVSIQGAGLAVMIWFVTDSLSQAALLGLGGFTTSYLTSTRSKDAVSDLDKLKPIIADLLAAGGESIRSAAILINTAIEQHPRDAWLLYARAVVLTSDCLPSLGFSGYLPSLTNRKAAIDDLDLAIDLDASLADAWLLRARQKAFFKDVSESEDSPAFDRENILADFDQAVKQTPNNAEALAERGQFLESQLRNYTKAEAD